MNRFAVIILISYTLLNAGTVLAGEDVVTVITRDYKFIPKEVTVKAGTTVRWDNQEKRQYHSVYFKDLADQEESDYFFPGEMRQRTFNKPGTYPYYCEPHVDTKNMVGVIHVVE